ncbi:uncharacterized protein NEMAJ01_1470 [Nematocida major]|uniref:uncharacterized protein n=1 Tax=Nematocida major TaxID=1912982 RepID=UPI0020086BBE|nr:uncharacterized protein NEMAJ01_1470 [Nematocida major]KAH9386574.1 hypothetical protein NEMAJ01_1470 [Nematocida major]
MKNRIHNTNSLFGSLLSLYGNLDYGKPRRLRAKSIKQFFGRFYHLTHIGLLLTTVTLLIGLLRRNMKPSSRNSRVYAFMRSAHIDLLALTVTVECFIPAIFWGLWWIDESTVVVKSSYVGEDTISLFFNLCMHGFPTVFLLVEFFEGVFLSRRVHYIIISGFFAFYIAVMVLFYNKTGTWPYGVIEGFSPLGKVAFFGFCFACVCFVYKCLVSAHEMVWKDTRDRKGSRED